MAEIGEIIGERYQLTGELGQGAMSIVYAAIDQKLGREVAVKMLLPHLARQPEAVVRFQREAAAVAQLDDHPNIVRIYDYSGPDVSPAYLVMELVEGETLSSFMANNKTQWPDLTALLVEPLTAALTVAHGRHIVHRDIKPENIMVTRGGQLKLVDFGIARAADAATITATGSLMGSPAYMAPEYLNGESADFTADIYSIGVLLYHLATGRLPFDAPTPAALFKRVCDGNFTPPEQQEPRLTKTLNNIIQKAMALDKRARFQSAAELQAALRDHLNKLGLEESSLTNYLAAPAEFSQTQLNRWLENLTLEAQAAAKKGRTNRALSCYQLILAFRPDDEATLLALKKQQSWLKVRGQMPKAAAGLLVFSALVAGGLWYHSRPVGTVAGADQQADHEVVRGDADYLADQDSGASQSGLVEPIADQEVAMDGADSRAGARITADSESGSGANSQPVDQPANEPVVTEVVAPALKGDLPLAPARSRANRYGRPLMPRGKTAAAPNGRNNGAPPAVSHDDTESEARDGEQKPAETPSGAGNGLAGNMVATDNNGSAPGAAVHTPAVAGRPQPESTANAAAAPIEVTLHAFPFASIWVDGELKAKNAMNPLALDLTPGRHDLRFEHPAALPQQRTIVLEKGQAPTQIKVHMEPLPASLVVVAPKGTIVELDNKSWLTLTDGKNEARLIELPNKQFRHSYKVTLTEPGQEPWSRVVELTAGQVSSIGRREH